MAQREIRLRSQATTRVAHAAVTKSGVAIHMDGAEPVVAEVVASGDCLLVLKIGDRMIRGFVVRDGAQTWVSIDGATYAFHVDHGRAKGGSTAEMSDIHAPMTGKVVEVVVADGEAVAARDVLLVLEAMKMEHRLTAPAAGRVTRVLVKAGQIVNVGDKLVELAPPEPAP